MEYLPDDINLIKSLFRGRQDVYYHYSRIDYFDKMFKQRNRYYKKLLKKSQIL